MAAEGYRSAGIKVNIPRVASDITAQEAIVKIECLTTGVNHTAHQGVQHCIIFKDERNRNMLSHHALVNLDVRHITPDLRWRHIACGVYLLTPLLLKGVTPDGFAQLVLNIRFSVNFTVIFHSLQDNPVFQNYREQYEGHRAV